jgi:hypothetical protein
VGLEKKAKAAQLSVLKKYGVLADFSDLEEVTLDRMLKGRLAAAIAQELTFANWCEQVLGQGRRVPIARFDHQVAGQTRLGNLAVLRDLAGSLKAHDRKAQTQLKASEQEVARLKAELNALRQSKTRTAVFAPLSDTAEALQYWYYETTAPLHRILWEIKEIEGGIFDNQGQFNRDYRQQLVEIILCALSSLESLGFCVEAELRDASPKEPVFPTVVLHRSHSTEGADFGVEGFAFEVKDIQPDVLVAASERLFLRRDLPEIDKRHRFNCHVKVSVSPRLAHSEDELFHLSCFIYKLFEAMARSGDSRPRGTLREKVILCLILSSTAPCMPARLKGLEMLRLQDTFYKGHEPIAWDSSKADADVSAGKIVEHFFRTLHANVSR